MLVQELQSFNRSLIATSNLTWAYRRNRLKELLHLYVLDFLYKHDKFRELIFYGGTCLRHCFGLPRLSEDLDFEYLEGAFPFARLADEVQAYFRSAHDYDALTVKAQKVRLYLKFPVLRELGMADADASNFLQLKIEINVARHDKGTFRTEIQPLFIMQKTFFVKRYDLPTLMASKINALLNRHWSRKNREGGTVSDVKGRDYFDLLWYMQKGIVPRLGFTAFDSSGELWKAVEEKVIQASAASIKNDLVDFLEDPRDGLEFARNLPAAFEALRKKY